nr:unnamed protein product [Callosobruchus analis]
MAMYFLGENLERRGGALNSNRKMKVFLRYMASPEFQMGVAEELGITQSTVSKTISFVMNKILEKSHLWIKLPSTQPKINEAQQAWQEKFQFPSAIDCTHVKFLKPNQHGDEYINRKGLATINMQTTCISVEVFTRADVSWPGSVHAARIWRDRDVRPMRQLPGTALLGDDGYGLEP